MATPTSPFIDFDKLNATDYIYRPSQASPRNQDASPALIIICSWMAAPPRPVAKYTEGYRRLYPNSTILLIQSTYRDVVRSSDKTMVARLQQAVEVIKSVTSEGNDEEERREVILHAFSNGGGTIASHLAMQLQDHRKGRKLFDRVIFECMPSWPGLNEGVKAVSYSLPKNPIIRFLGMALFRFWFWFGLTYCAWRGIEDVLTRLRRRLNTTSFFDPSAPRLYLYSRADELVPWRHVVEHAEDARDKGYKIVEEEVFEEAAHCALPREDAGRYWRVIESWVNGTV